MEIIDVHLSTYIFYTETFTLQIHRQNVCVHIIFHVLAKYSV